MNQGIRINVSPNLKISNIQCLRDVFIISSPTFVAEWRLQFSCTFGVLGLLLNPNSQVVANRGVVS